MYTRRDVFVENLVAGSYELRAKLAVVKRAIKSRFRHRGDAFYIIGAQFFRRFCVYEASLSRNTVSASPNGERRSAAAAARGPERRRRASFPRGPGVLTGNVSLNDKSNVDCCGARSAARHNAISILLCQLREITAAGGRNSRGIL